MFSDSLLMPLCNDASRVVRIGDLCCGVGERTAPKIFSHQPFLVSSKDRQELLWDPPHFGLLLQIHSTSLVPATEVLGHEFGFTPKRL